MQVIKLFGADWCLDCHRAKAFLKENKTVYDSVIIGAGAEVLNPETGEKQLISADGAFLFYNPRWHK
jgi:glutaredoxin